MARDGIIFTESDIEVMRPALHGTAAYPEPSARITCILELFTIRKIAQGSQPEGDQALHRRDEDIGRAAPRRPGPRPGQSACMQPPDQVAADVLTEPLPAGAGRIGDVLLQVLKYDVFGDGAVGS